VTEEAALTPLVIGVTSHRNIPAGEIDPIRQRVRELFAQLQREFPQLPLIVLSALAEGGDQLVAQEAVAAGIRVVAPLPLPRAIYAQDFCDDAARQTFAALCAQAHVIELPLLPGHTAQEVERNGVERDRQYAQAGVFIARHCHLLLAIWDGRESDRLGGTAQVVQYYLHGVMPGLIERRRGARRWLSGHGDARPIFHAVCSRDAPDGTPAQPLCSGQAFWRTAGTMSSADAALPEDLHETLSRAAQFNADARKYCERIAGAAADPVERDAAPALAALFRSADWLALHFQKRVLLAMRITYSVAALMGIAFAIYDNLTAADSFIYVFLVLFAVGVTISTIARRRAWHRKYLDYRALAEGLRVQAYWRRAGISLTDDPEFAQDSLLQKQDVELTWVRNTMRSAGLQRFPGDPRERDARLQSAIRDWVGDDLSGQLGYYRAKALMHERRHRINEWIDAVSLYAAILISIVLAALAFRLSADTKNLLIVSMAVFSVSGAVREAYAFRKADKELIKQYRFMRRLFADARAALARASDAMEQREILRALGEAALAEHTEWAVMHRQRPLEHGRI